MLRKLLRNRLSKSKVRGHEMPPFFYIPVKVNMADAA